MKKNLVYMTFSIGSNPIQIKTKGEENKIYNFSSSSNTITKKELKFFSLNNYINSTKSSPKEALKNRIMEVVDYVNFTKKDLINKEAIFNYIANFALELMVNTLNKVGKPTNIMLAFGLNHFTKDLKSIYNFQNTVNRYAKEKIGLFSSSKGIDIINRHFNEMIVSLMENIDRKFFDEDKKGIFSQGISQRKVENFSAKTKNITRLEALLNLSSTKEEVKSTLEHMLKLFSKEEWSKLDGIGGYPILADSDITDYILKANKDKSIEELADYLYESSQIENFSTSSVIPLMTCPKVGEPEITYFYNLMYGNWFMIFKKKIEGLWRVVIRKFPKKVPYKLLALDDEQVEEYFSNQDYIYYEGDFQDEFDADAKIKEIQESALMAKQVNNFGKRIIFSDLIVPQTKEVKICKVDTPAGYIVMLAYTNEDDIALEIIPIPKREDTKELTHKIIKQFPVLSKIYVENEKELIEKCKEFAKNDYTDYF